MRRLMFVPAILIAGCTSATDQAEREYAIVNKSGDASEVCRKGRDVAEAYLQAGDADRYNARKVEVSIDCQGRTLDEQAGIFRMPDGSSQHIEADNMEALADNTAE
jgi:hypothetical protein